MKTAVCKTLNRPAFPCPNAATRQEVLHKILDTLLVAVSGMGIAAILLLFLVL